MRVLISKGVVFISKPRCGSTSIRRMFSPLISREAGDIEVDVAGVHPPFHPHITAPYLREVLRKRGVNVSSLVFITTIRNPVEMLWSYYNYFMPDSCSRYSFSPGWEGGIGMNFEKWIIEGHLGMNPKWQEMAPTWISTNNLSPLSLEAHSDTREGERVIDRVFKLEEQGDLEVWLRDRCGLDGSIPHVNQSNKTADSTKVGEEALMKIREMFPRESEIYNL